MLVVASQFFSDADRLDCGCCKVTAMVYYVRHANTKQRRMVYARCCSHPSARASRIALALKAPHGTVFRCLLRFAYFQLNLKISKPELQNSPNSGSRLAQSSAGPYSSTNNSSLLGHVVRLGQASGLPTL